MEGLLPLGDYRRTTDIPRIFIGVLSNMINVDVRECFSSTPDIYGG
jgi:hypothetical protein